MLVLWRRMLLIAERISSFMKYFDHRPEPQADLVNSESCERLGAAYIFKDALLTMANVHPSKQSQINIIKTVGTRKFKTNVVY